MGAPPRLGQILILLAGVGGAAVANAQTPVTGHYPPGQSGIRGASTPDPGFAVTNFNRFFTNVDVPSAAGAEAPSSDELRYANITMIQARLVGKPPLDKRPPVIDNRARLW